MDNSDNILDPLNTLLSQTEEERVNTLTPEQQKIVLEMWEGSATPPELRVLVEACWGVGTDSRSWKGRLVREFLASKQLRAKAAQDYIPKPKIDLTPEQKEFITNNCGTMTTLEITKEIFNNKNLTPLHQETRAVVEFLKTINPKVLLYNNEDLDTNEISAYTPPKTMPQVVARINRYIYHPIDEKKITPKQKKSFTALIGYVHTERFRVQMNTFTKVSDRILFESEFIRCTYDKEDLTEEEVDQYIIYATEVLIGKSILDRIDALERNQDEALAQDGRMNMALVEAVRSIRDEYNKCVKRQNDILNDLKGKRRERLNLQMKDNASILNLVNLWKEQESRQQIIELARKEQERVREEIERLSSLEEVKAKICGLTSEEALYG